MSIINKRYYKIVLTYRELKNAANTDCTINCSNLHQSLMVFTRFLKIKSYPLKIKAEPSETVYKASYPRPAKSETRFPRAAAAKTKTRETL